MNITIPVPQLTHLGGADFSTEISDLGQLDSLPMTITVRNPKTGGGRVYALERAVRNMDNELEKWVYTSPLGGTVHLFND